MKTKTEKVRKAISECGKFSEWGAEHLYQIIHEYADKMIDPDGVEAYLLRFILEMGTAEEAFINVCTQIQWQVIPKREAVERNQKRFELAAQKAREENRKRDKKRRAARV